MFIVKVTFFQTSISDLSLGSVGGGVGINSTDWGNLKIPKMKLIQTNFKVKQF